MSTQEGVIKFELCYRTAPAPAWSEVRELDAWRTILVMTELIGQTPDRYAGYGFGNISCRIEPLDAPAHQRAFLITGTQTGGADHLTAQGYTTVVEYHPEKNLLMAEGPVRPSSESLTHGAVYDLDDRARWVMHAHSPHIWRHATELGIPATRAEVAYGTPEMAAEVARLFRETDVAEQGIFAMEGHEDGVVTFGASAEEAGAVMMNALAHAMALEPEPEPEMESA